MGDITLVILCAGNSTRFKHTCKKQWIRIDNEPLWLNVANRLSNYYSFKKIIITTHKNELKYMKNFSDDFFYVKGGNTRQESIKNTLKYVDTKYVMITDVARSCIPKEVLMTLIKEKEKASCIVPVLDVTDTVIYEGTTINREKTKLIQTPQLSNTKVLKTALESTKMEFTDESSAIKNNKESILYVKGSSKSKKLTFGDEFEDMTCLKKPAMNFFTGIGVDIHQFEENKKMYLGGIHIPYEYGFKAHSDGDVLIHSLIDALLGAIGAGDIGEFFPDTKEEYKNIDSSLLLKNIVEFVNNVGYEIVNIDLTILAEKPKVNEYKNKIKNRLSELLNIKKQFINIKATRGEKMGFIGRAEGVLVQSVVNVKYYNWEKNEYINY